MSLVNVCFHGLLFFCFVDFLEIFNFNEEFLFESLHGFFKVNEYPFVIFSLFYCLCDEGQREHLF